MLAGRTFVGVDLNPLAIQIARTKARRVDKGERQHFVSVLHHVTERSLERVRERVPCRAPLSKDEVKWYGPHTLKELAGLREEILAVEEPATQQSLLVLFSAIIVKFSKQRGDTSLEKVEKRIRKGLPSEFFLRRGKELVDRWAELAERLPTSAPAPIFREGDARKVAPHLKAAGWKKVDLVVTSPPYGGTYNYASHHARRMPWLKLDDTRLEQKEIGARRRLQGKHAKRSWNEEMIAVLKSLSGVLAPDGLIVLLQGDAQLAGQRVEADTQLRKIGASVGLKVVATATQERPDWTGREARREHLIAIRASAA